MANLNIAKYKKFLVLIGFKLFARCPALQTEKAIAKAQIKVDVYSKIAVKYIYKFSLVIANNLIKIPKEDADEYSYRANCYYGLENYELALADYNKAIELNPDDAEAYLGRANCYEKQENHELALADYNKAIELKPDFTAAFISLANYYEKQENHELNLATLNKEIASNPDLPDAYFARANYLRNRNEHELALADFIKAIELDKIEVLFIAIDYLKQGNHKISLEIISKYIELIPDFAFAYAMRSQCYFAQKSYELSLADCNKAIELSPNFSLAYQSKAMCYLNQKNYELALINFNKVIELNPNSDDNIYYLKDGCQCWIYRNSFDLQIKQKNYDLVLADYVKAIKLNNGDYFRKFLCIEFMRVHIIEYRKFVDILIKYGLKSSDLSKSDLSEDEINSLDNSIFKKIDKAIKSSVSTEDKKEYCLLASNILCELNEFDKAEKYIKQAFENFDSTEQSYKDIYLQDIRKAREIEKQRLELIETNKRLDEKNKELNNLIAMFAHNFLGTLQCIRSNAEHDNNAKIHLKTVKMMSGALTAFSIISADDEKLIEQLKQDNTGETNLLQNLANNLALAVSQLLSKTNKDKIINIYLNYLKKTAQIKPETNGEDLRFNENAWEKWNALQQQWEDEFNALFSENVELSRLQTWLETNFFPVQIIGFNDYTIRFKEYGITDSIFLVVFMEILVNALKYTDVSKNKPLIITLCKEHQTYQLTCENPSAQESYRGTHKGMDFLKSIAKKVNGQFITESTEQSFKTTFIIPAELLE